MTTTENVFASAGHLLSALRKLDRAEQKVHESVRARYARKRGDLINTFPKAAQTLVVQQLQREMSETEPPGVDDVG